MLEEKLQLLQGLLEQDSVDKREIKRLLASLNSNERDMIIGKLSNTEYRKFIEVTLSVSFKLYAEIMKACDKEYDRFVQTPNFFDQLVANHQPLSDEEISQNILLVEKQRKKLVEGQDYAFLLYEGLCQHANLKASQTTILDYLDRLDLNLEFMTLYLDFLTIYTDSFIDRDVEKIKNSIKNSIYCGRSSYLLEQSIANLEKNNPDSFLVLPIIQAPSSEGAHNSVIVLKNKENVLELTMLDKGMHYSQELYQSVPTIVVKEQANSGFMSYLKSFFGGSNNPNIKAAIPYVFEVENSEAMRTRLSYLLGFGTSTIGQSIQLSVATREKKYLILEEELKKIASKSYWGREIYDVQLYTKNCYIKSVSAAMQHVLGDKQQSKTHYIQSEPAELKKIPHHSARTITVALAEIIKNRIRKLGYTQEATQTIDDLLGDYLTRKNQNYDTKGKYAETTKLIEKYAQKNEDVFEKNSQVAIDVAFIPNNYQSSYLKQSKVIGQPSSFLVKELLQLSDLEEIETVKAEIQTTLASYQDKPAERRTLSDVANMKGESNKAQKDPEKQAKKDSLER
ncbi:hypothetical protein EGW35_01625 [Enterococcus durans]|uniref:hypothetical protein n=1 Tax=Enterococcus durans TaxID=53345 RepID=UPI000F504B47|nr:hypothetical protein [Enterococcus durans]ROX85286.1 hypothetical protein EGW35_01625 [Enterococcus durans]